jgi:hypothetical protein
MTHTPGPLGITINGRWWTLIELERLTAAAPDLLEQAKKALALLEEITASAFEAGVMSDLPAGAAGKHTNLRAAIAKAEGK